MKQLMASLLLVIITTGAPPHPVVAFSSLTQQASYQQRPLANHPCRINTLTSCVNFSRSTSLLFANKEDDSGSLSHEIEHTSSSTNISGSIISDIIQKNDSNIISTQPPKFLSLGYKIASITNIISGLLLLVNIPTIQSVAISSFSSSISSVDAATQLLSSSTRYQPNLLATYTAGTLGYLFLSGGVCNILSNATKAKVSNSNSSCRLYTSDTYKRLNKGILLFSIMGLFSIPGEAGCLLFSANNDNKMNMMFGIVAFITIQLTNLLTATTSFIGWECSVPNGFGVSRKDRIKNMFNEVGKGLKNIYNNFPVTEQRPATFYRTFWIILSIGNLMFNIPELIFNIQQLLLGGVGTSSLFLPVSLTMSSIARLGLLSFILYVLKDAAERKRLEGTTFIKLNMMVGLWAVGGELYIMSIHLFCV